MSNNYLNYATIAWTDEDEGNVDRCTLWEEICAPKKKGDGLTSTPRGLLGTGSWLFVKIRDCNVCD